MTGRQKLACSPHSAELQTKLVHLQVSRAKLQPSGKRTLVCWSIATQADWSCVSIGRNQTGHGPAHVSMGRNQTESLLTHISRLLRLQASFDDLHATRTDLQSGLLGLLVTPQVR